MLVTLLGATGLVGNECRKVLEKADFVERLILPVRRIPGDAVSGAKAEWTLTDFSKLQERKDLFAADAVICCLCYYKCQPHSLLAKKKSSIQKDMEALISWQDEEVIWLSSNSKMNTRKRRAQ